MASASVLSLSSCSPPARAAAATRPSSAVTQPPVRSLQSLPMRLLELVLRFLPVRDKMLELTHLSYDFPPLTAVCFSESGLNMRQPAVRAALTRAASLQALLCCIRHLSLCAVYRLQPARHGWEHAPRLPVRLGSFTRLQRLSVRLERSGRGGDAAIDLREVLTPLSSVPVLRSLSIDAMHRGAEPTFVRLSELELLCALRSLRSLTLRGTQLAAGALSLLCSLPLQHLALRRAMLGTDNEPEAQTSSPALAALAAARTADVSRTLRRLQLLQIAYTSHAKKELRRVLEAYAADSELRGQTAQLELVDLDPVLHEEELQRRLLCIPSLTALVVTVAVGTRLLPQPVPASLMLPQLRCLAVVIVEPEEDNEEGANAWQRGAWLSALSECDRFLRSYAGQLLRLELAVLPNQPAAASILQAAFHCQQLRHLVLKGSGGGAADDFAQLSFTQLPQLHRLCLSDLDLNSAQLSSLLRACPAVEHIVLSMVPAFTLGLLPCIGRHCRLLKVLEADWCTPRLFCGPVQTQLTQAEQAARNAVFPQLVALTITLFVPPGRAAFSPASPHTLQWLLRLLQSAPVLRFLRLDLRLDESELPLFSSLSALRGFRLSRQWKPLQQRFFHSADSRRLPQADSTRWQPEHEADRERELAALFRHQGALFRDTVEGFNGRTGREAFFAAILAQPASEDEDDDGSEDDSSCDSTDERPRDDDNMVEAESDLDDEDASATMWLEEEDAASEEEKGRAKGRKRRRSQEC